MYVKINYSRWAVPAKRRADDKGGFSSDEIAEAGSGEPYQAEKSGTFGGQVRDIAEVRSGPSARHEDTLDTISGIAEAKGGCCGSWTSAVGPGSDNGRLSRGAKMVLFWGRQWRRIKEGCGGMN